MGGFNIQNVEIQMNIRNSLFILLLLACAAMMAQEQPRGSEESAIRQMCTDIATRYPEATLQDVYKTCYQDFFGAEHLMRDTVAARNYLHYELEQMTKEPIVNTIPFFEPTGFRHRYVRVNLREVIEKRMTEDELLLLFIEAATDEKIQSLKNEAMNGWAKEWEQIERIALLVHPSWSNEALQKALREAAEMQQAVHHSETFQSAYKPHYRIIKNQKKSK